MIVSNCSLVSKSVKKWVPSYLEKSLGNFEPASPCETS